MDLEKLPKELKSKIIICLWKYEQQENGRLTKTPYNPITGMKAAIDSLSDFSSLDVVMKVKNQYDGIGIKLVDNSGIKFVKFNKHKVINLLTHICYCILEQKNAPPKRCAQ